MHIFKLTTIIITCILPKADKIEILENLNRSPLLVR